MKIFIPSKGRSKIASTHKYLGEDADYTYFLDSLEEVKNYEKEGIPRSKIEIVPEDVSGNLIKKRVFLTEYAKANGLEYYMTLDDDITKVLGVSQEVGLGKVNRVMLKHKMPAEEFLRSAEMFYQENAERGHCQAVGFACTDNPLSRKVRVNYFGKISASAIIINCTDKNNLKRDTFPIHKEEEDYTLQVIAQSGRFPRLNYMYPYHGMYLKGGLGEKDQIRTKKQIEAVNHIIKKYGDKFVGIRTKKSETFIQGTELMLKVSKKNVKEFRALCLNRGSRFASLLK